MENLRIAHISDVHCKAESKWDELYFKPLLECLKEQSPQVILITGDCVDNATKKNFRAFSSAVGRMLESAKTGLLSRPTDPQDQFLITVPGNHDAHEWYGISSGWMPVALREAHYNAAMSDFLFPQPSVSADKKRRKWNARLGIFSKIPGVKNLVEKLTDLPDSRGFLSKEKSEDPLFFAIRKLYERYCIAIYPLNSNRAFGNFIFARGGLKNLTSAMNRYNEIFLQATSIDTNRSFGDALKIALLHHNPLPILNPSSLKQLESQQSLELDNPHDLLEACSENGIHMIFHGHKHRSSEFNIEYRNMNGELYPLILSGAGTAAKSAFLRKNSGPWEIKILKLDKGGNWCLGKCIRSKNKEKFSRPSEFCKVFPYARRRRLRWERDRIPDDPVREAASKSKSVDIDVEGGAWIRVATKGIEWTDDAKTSKSFYIQDHFRGDTGRINRVWTDFSEKEQTRSIAKQNIFEPRKNFRNTSNAPDAPEALHQKFISQSDINDPWICRHTYYLHNGFATTDMEHEECYPDWKQKNPTLHLQEAVTAAVYHRVRSLDIVVRFPHDRIPERFRLEAFQRNDAIEHVPDGMEDLYRAYPLHEEETAWLQGAGSWTVWREFGVVTAHIALPLPGISYVLRWDMPEDPVKVRMTTMMNAQLDTLCDAVNDNRNTEVREMFKIIAAGAEACFGPESLVVFLLGWKRSQGTLHIVRAHSTTGNFVVDPDQCKPMYVGRSTSGKAFRTRKPVVWDREIENACSPDHSPMLSQMEESVVPRLDPQASLSVPLLFPDVISSADVRPEEREKMATPFGVVTVVAQNRNSSLSKMIQEEFKSSKKSSDKQTSWGFSATKSTTAHPPPTGEIIRHDSRFGRFMDIIRGATEDVFS